MSIVRNSFRVCIEQVDDELQDDIELDRCIGRYDDVADPMYRIGKVLPIYIYRQFCS